VQTNRGGPAERAGLRGWRKVQREERRGPLVYTIEKNDPSAADIIIAVDGEPMDEASKLIDKIDGCQPGQRVVLTIIRQGQQMDVPVTLGSRSTR
jgi:S1-C subfamily serine protease